MFFFVFFYSKGSVIAKIKLIFNPEFANNDNETTLANAVATGKVGSLEVDKDSFSVVGKQIALFIFIILHLYLFNMSINQRYECCAILNFPR